MKQATLVRVYGKRIWIESDILGDKHVIVQHDAPGCEPFTYCTFHYDYAHTSNAAQILAAERVAVSLGAAQPIERKHRDLLADLSKTNDHSTAVASSRDDKAPA